jgi:iron complex outermembrane receptor protein
MATRNAPRSSLRWSPLALAVTVAIAGVAADVRAQEKDTTKLEGVVVTGSRIKKTEVEGAAPVFTIERADIEKTGLGSVGDIVQQLTASGRALNTKFNSSGNFGYPPEGGGIGAGSAQIDLRHLGSQRVLVLVDGKRWVNETSASGVGGSVDLNTIPLAIVERIEVLEDGASAIYGSDAIAGVVNVITRRNYNGAEVNTSYGEYDEGDGETTKADVTFGGGNDRFTGVFSASYYEQKRISAGDRSISRLPIPDEENGPFFGSSRNEGGRWTFCDPRISPNCDDFLDITLNQPVPGTPVYNPNNPTSGTSTFHPFGGADRFNYAPYNLVLTPSERKSVFASIRYNITDNVTWSTKALYNKRESTNQAAPEPIVLGPVNGTGTLSDRIVISALNPYNPFGIDLDPAFNFGNYGRRPLEAGPRIFNQDVDTYYFNTGFEGTFGFGDRSYSWDVYYSKSESDAEQQFFNGFNLRRLQLGLGDPAICAQNPGCVPIDLWGGVNRDGTNGSLTPEMLAWARFTTKDSGKQELDVWSGNVTGDLFDMPAGPVGFAVGAEYREYAGEFIPDQARIVGESQDSAAIATSGSYDVTEFYGEFNVPLLADMTLAKKLEIQLAARYSDYSNFGSETTMKAGFRWQPIDDLVVRGNYSEGFRAPFIGELFGSAQFGASITDPCGPINGPLPTGQLAANCAALGVPVGYRAVDTQITTTTGGNPNLDAESSDSWSAGAVYSPTFLTDLSWSRKMDFEATYYHHEIDGAIQAPDAQDKLNFCVASGNPNSNFCQGITRNPSGNINRFFNLLDNLGEIQTAGWDFKASWLGPDMDWGRLSAALQATRVNSYVVTDVFGNRFSRTVGREENDGAIPEWQTNMQFDWAFGDWSVHWDTRFIDGVKETCIDTGVPKLCSDPTARGGAGENELDETWYNDLQVAWTTPFGGEGLRFALGVNNVFDEDPPKCGSCTLNGYDASTYEVPGRFYYVEVGYKFH